MRISDWSSDVCSSDLPQKRPTALAVVRLSEERSNPSGFARPTGRPSLCEDSQGRGCGPPGARGITNSGRSEEHTSELQSLMRISYAVFGLKQKRRTDNK